MSTKEYWVGDIVWAGFPERTVRASVLDTGTMKNGKQEIKVRGEGTSRGEWIPSEWCKPA